MLIRLILLLFVLGLSPQLKAEEIRLHVPIIEEHTSQHHFFHELLKESLIAAGHTPELITQTLPQLRANKLMETGDISIIWLLESEARNKQFVPVEVGLTKGLIGQRVMLIRKEEQARFNDISTLEQLQKKNFHTALGKKWFDIDIWQENQLPYVSVDGNWRTMFKLLKKGRVDYLSRSVIEVTQENKEHPELTIEKNLMLIYNRDYRFYLSHTGKHSGKQYKALLENALRRAKSSGLLDRLIHKYWKDDFEQLGYEHRRHIYLQTPK